MKTTLILSAIAVVSVLSTASFAQNFVSYSTAQVNAVTTVKSGFTAADLGYQGGPKQHRLRTTAGR